MMTIIISNSEKKNKTKQLQQQNIFYQKYMATHTHTYINGNRK